MNAPLAASMLQAQQTFVAESRGLLAEMEQVLLQLEHEAADAERLNGLFRAAHTIKGSAGLFGLDGIVAFTHRLEELLDRVRAGTATLDPAKVELLLGCADHLSCRLDAVEAGDAEALPAEARAEGERLSAALAAALEGPQAAGGWHLSLRFGADVFRNGMDPAGFLRYLGRLGDIRSLAVVTDAIPAAADLDPESCHLGFELSFESEASRAEILQVFEFVREDCAIRLLAPDSKVEDYVRLIRELPEDDLRIGRMLVECGALTRAELDAGLAVQQAAGDDAPRIGEVLVESGAVSPAVVSAAAERQEGARARRGDDARYLRVSADRLDHVINLVGELVIASAGANLLAQRGGDPSLHEATQSVIRFVEEIRNEALQLRMVQIGETFARFRRVVRDVSKELGKDIALEIRGAETELDKTVVEKIADPLMHLIRNAIDHGIEDAAARAAAGKPAQGTVRLNAHHDSGSIVIEVGDDGKGLDRERILKKARERGVVGPTQVLSDDEVLQLIFAPGLSTAEQVTNLSGRGVGMDVVKKNIEALRGTVSLASRPGQGTTVTIRLPLTLAIIDGFLVGVGEASYVVPLSSVVECIELKGGAGSGDVLNLRGEPLPFLRLRDALGLGGARARRESVVVVHWAGRRAGLVVDALVGEFQTVIKPLGALFEGLRGIGGSTILGNGEVALILDVPALLGRAVSAPALH